jgi:hypothetical protein
MKFGAAITFLVLTMALVPHNIRAGEGIAPEQIFQSVVDWNKLVGTWEALPNVDPLNEKAEAVENTSNRVLMTLRKDGTCRIFNKDHPTGTDGLWTFGDHDMFVKFKNGRHLGFFVYGIKGDFMVTRSPIKAGKDQLWSKVK